MKTTYVLLLSSFLFFVACKKDAALTNTPPPAVPQARAIPVPNGDFENWDWQLRPTNWYTNGCALCVGAPFDEYVVKKDSQTVYHGAYSALFMYNYNFQAYAKIKFPLTIHPNQLQAHVFCYLYTPDTVSISIKLLKNSHTVDSGYWQSTMPITNFTQINIPITTGTAIIDSAVLLIKGGKNIAPNNFNTTAFWVDDLVLFK